MARRTFKTHGLRKCWRKRPVVTRVVMALCLPFLPLVLAAAAIYEERQMIARELGDVWDAITRRWED